MKIFESLWRKLKLGGVFYWLFGTLITLIFAFPMIFMMVSSLKPDQQIFVDLKSFQAFIPAGEVSIHNYENVFKQVPVFTFLMNSAVTSAIVVVLGLAVNSLAGFALSRVSWKGQGIVLGLLIAMLMVPFETIAIPMVYLVSKLPWVGIENGAVMFKEGMMNSFEVQILPFVASAFSIFLFVQYFKSIPKELDEAALIDGASWFTIYRRVIMPLAGPAFATCAILNFLPIWNAYLWPIMVIQEENLRPVQVGLQYFFQMNVQWGEIMAYTTIITLPVLVLFVAFQRAFVASIASTGVKG
jgi:multiple sugar transport system permease protein